MAADWRRFMAAATWRGTMGEREDMIAASNDAGAARYNKAVSDLIWSRTLAFFKENLGDVSGCH